MAWDEIVPTAISPTEQPRQGVHFLIDDEIERPADRCGLCASRFPVKEERTTICMLLETYVKELIAQDRFLRLAGVDRFRSAQTFYQ